MAEHHDPSTLGSVWLPEPPADVAPAYAVACRLAAWIAAPAVALVSVWLVVG